MVTRKLTSKQDLFVKEYLVDLNATQAAIRAGYSKRRASEIGYQLLRKTTVAAAITEQQQKRAAKTDITAEKVLRELALLGFSNTLDYVEVQPDGSAYVDLSALTREQAAAIQEITVDEYMEGHGDLARPVKKVKVKLADKKSSLELLGKHLGLFDDRIRLSGEVGVKIVDNIPEGGKSGDPA